MAQYTTVHTKHPHKVENKKWTKAYQAEGYHDIVSFFQLSTQTGPSKHQSAADVALWAQEVAFLWEEEQEEEEEHTGLIKECMVDVHSAHNGWAHGSC